MRPSIEIDLGRTPRQMAKPYAPGDVLTCDYSVINPSRHQLVAIEASVIWLTCGKGDQDIGVHFFERRLITAADLKTGPSYRLSTVLPASPLSYDGQIVKIGWRVRVRLFVIDNGQITQDQPFCLGNIAMCRAVNSSDEVEEQ